MEIQETGYTLDFDDDGILRCPECQGTKFDFDKEQFDNGMSEIRWTCIKCGATSVQMGY